jgi:hypothetical protein
MNGTASEKSGAAIGINLRASLQEHEAALIRQALRFSDGNRRRAAALLQLPLRTFERKLRKMLRDADRSRAARMFHAPADDAPGDHALGDQGSDQQRDDCHHLDEDGYARTRRVLEGVADRVAHDGSLVGI